MYCLIALAVTLSYVLHLYIQSLFNTTTCSYSLRLSLLIYLTKTHSRIHMLPIHVHTLTYTRTYTHTVTWILKVWQPGESYPPGPPLLWGRWTRVSSTLNSLQCSLSVSTSSALLLFFFSVSLYLMFTLFSSSPPFFSSSHFSNLLPYPLVFPLFFSCFVLYIHILSILPLSFILSFILLHVPLFVFNQ